MKNPEDRVIIDIWCEFEEWRDSYDENDENSNVIFKLSDNSYWSGTFYTYQNLFTLSKRNLVSGELLFGKYFYSDKPIFVDKLNKETVISVINDILRKGETEYAFDRIDENK